MPDVAAGIAPLAQTLVLLAIGAVALVASAMGFVRTRETLRVRQAPKRDGWAVGNHARRPGDLSREQIDARVAQLAALGALPAGWTPRDAARLVRVHARRARLVAAEHRSSAA